MQGLYKFDINIKEYEVEFIKFNKNENHKKYWQYYYPLHKKQLCASSRAYYDINRIKVLVRQKALRIFRKKLRYLDFYSAQMLKMYRSINKVRLI